MSSASSNPLEGARDGVGSSATAAGTDRLSRLLVPVLELCLLVSAAAVSFYPFFAKSSWLTYPEDDFFYYLKIAANVASGHGSTFNGLVPTNGYHPLWLWVISGVVWLSPAGRGVEVFLSLAIFAATMVTFVLSRRLLSRHVSSPLLVTALAVYVASYSEHLFVGGMEIILTVPLLMAAVIVFQGEGLWQRRFWPAFGFGLLLAALFLSRLDTLLVIWLLVAAILVHPVLRRSVSVPQLTGAAVGFLPAVLYVASNRYYFHTWLTISGMAKELKPNHLPTSAAWKSLFGHSPVHLINLIPIVAAMVVLPVVFRRLTAKQQAVYPIALFFPFLYVAVLSCISDWGLWDWYFYGLRISLCVALALLLVWPAGRSFFTRKWVTVAVACYALLLVARDRRSNDGGLEMNGVAIQIRDFAATHPGVYAMGDRSGIVGYMLPQPLVQTEGLVMDLPFLRLIEHRTPLDVALAKYDVRYYIATSHLADGALMEGGQPYTGCYQAVEPYQAGPSSATMKATLCQPPVASFTHNHLQTLIFDMKPNP